MNLNALQVFQTAINTNVAAKPDVRVGISSTNSPNWRVEPRPASDPDANNRIRRAFKDALVDAFDVERLDELPAEVKSVLKIRDFKIAKDGAVTSRRPLTMRRIRAVMGAVEKVATMTAKDDVERSEIQNAFRSQFSNSEIVGKGLARYAILTGKDPVMIPVGNGKLVPVPFSALKAYTKGISPKDLPSKVDSILARAERDVFTGAALYEEILSGSECVVSKENSRALRHYMAVVAIASGKYRNREISIEDPEGRIANYLNSVEPGAAKRVFANDSSRNCVDHTIITAEIELSGLKRDITRIRDVDSFYQKLKGNPFASSILSRKTAYGSFTVAQMYANAKAELARISTVGEEEMIEEASKELAARGAPRPYSMVQIGSTRAADSWYDLRMRLWEFLACVESHNPPLDHLEDRIGDEVVLSKAEIEKWMPAQNRDYVLSPTALSNRETPRSLSSGELRQPPASGFRFSAIASNDPFAYVKVCGFGDMPNGAARLFECMRLGCLPKGVELPPRGDVSTDGEHLTKEASAYIEKLDVKFLSLMAWYLESGAFKEDNARLLSKGFDLDTVRERPFWNAGMDGGSELQKASPETLRCLFDALKIEIKDWLNFRSRLDFVVPRPGFEARAAYKTLGEKAAESLWGFGTADIGLIAKFIRDCGYNLADITPETLGKLSALAALCDFKLAQVPTFIQRQTGKTISEVTKDDIVFLFNLKANARLNDKGQILKGNAKVVHSVLGGDMLPSSTEMSELDVISLLDVMRTFASEKTPQSLRFVELMGKKVSLRTTLAGTLVFGVDGYEFRAAKTPKEFIEYLEDDVLANMDRYGTHAVIRILPEIRGAELSDDPVARSRSRELCLRFLRGAAGINVASLSTVSTRKLFSIADGVVDGRYKLRSGELSQNALDAMLDKVVKKDVFTSKEAIALYKDLEKVREAEADIPVNIVRQPPASPQSADRALERRVHAFLADIVLDSDPYEFDLSRKRELPEERFLKIMRNNIDVIVEIMKKPDLIMTFPGSAAGVMGDFFGKLLPPISAKLLNQNEEILKKDVLFVLDNAQKPTAERRRAVMAHIESQGLKNGFKIFKGNALFAASEAFGQSLRNIDATIMAAVGGTMREVEKRLVEAIGNGIVAESQDPLWAQTFDEIIGNAMLDIRSGYGKFMYNVLSTYFSSSSPLEQRRMVAQLIRNVGSDSSEAAAIGEVFKGAGPLLHKMLQGLPAGSLGPELADALKDMKSNLSPIPESYVKACMMQIVERSQGQILSVTVERSLGAASVGQAFLCKMVTLEHPQGEECVVKILRPDVKTVISRERAIFEDAASKVPGMEKTFSGQFARILEELDFTLEATNVNFARNVYEQPPYLRQTSLATGRNIETLNLVDLHSMELHPLATPTMGTLVLKKAPGVTYDHFIAQTRAKIDNLLGEYYDEEDGLYRFPDPARAACVKIQLENLYNEILTRQKYLMDLTRKWVHEGLFGNGFYHGDLHAGNIMTDGKGLTVIDFGNATHLNDAERKEVLRMISAALVGWNDMFETSFKALLSPEGLADYNAANKDGKLSRDIAEVIKKGMRLDVGARIAAALMVMQRHGIEAPSSVYNFNQCQLRLGDTVDTMNSLMYEVADKMRHLSMSVIDAALAPESQNLALMNALLMNTRSFQEISGPGFRLSQQIELLEMLKEALADYKAGGRYVEGGIASIMADIGNEGVMRKMFVPLAHQLSQLRRLSTNTPEPRVLEKAGGGFNLHKAYEAFMKNDTEQTRKMLAMSFIDAIEDIVISLESFCAQRKLVGPETFLDAVGDSVSDSVYTVRTTLGNVTAMNIVREQDADDKRVSDAKVRLKAADSTVVRYAADNADADLSRADLRKIRSAVKNIFLPFDMPGIDGESVWKGNADSRGKVLGVMKVVVRRLVDELKRTGVLADDAPLVRQRIAVHVAMEFLAARMGSFSDAYKGWSNAERMNLLVELQSVEMDSAKRFPIAEAFLYLFKDRPAA